ncbi:MAG: MetQ/NlpA family ABC transporter substrate-binding protein [Mobiluncus porci]|uniref:MetQ/NlpA family ABC transporter substrate-binding protein n=1 Tax=Mobiluncus porci TaxID=2652278 RepID=UPI0023F58F91|nr:MetQ/NlpA family ABC transporter substrate-binding protein [Mobiluncus porci]MDD7541877.1 MetQ/NlpA family ABC transporter substrate-binding protein [Mobiluncus porci]MDY5749347.1 MetQ/NlpA family ABC transporter substrate-binding protein [Mobiluncus porci]
MKKFFTRIVVVAGAGFLAATLSACGGTNTASDVTELSVGASPVPHAKILRHLEDSGEAKKAGLKITVKEFTDYVQPNEALAGGDIDANYFQTVPYLKDQSASRGYKFVAGEGVHLEPLAVFSQKIKSFDELKDGATITIINDPANQGRALALLAANGLLELEGTDASVVEIKDDPKVNPRGFKFHEVEGPALVTSLPDVDIAVINGNFYQSAGLKPSDALAIESPEGNPAVNVLVWREDEKDKLDAIKKLDELLHSDVTKKYIEETWPGKEVIPSF